MKIAIDAMGGDYAPYEPIKGAVMALDLLKDLQIILVGKRKILEQELSKYRYDKNRIEIIEAEEVIGMDEEPVIAVRSKKNASMNIALDLVKNGEAVASVSAGNTGALIAASQLKLRRIKGVLRPAIATVFPTKKGQMITLDMGANADCKPEFLNQFAVMGSLYAKMLWKIEKPKVGLLNIGTEDGKGNEITRESNVLLKQNKKINYIGNIESRDMMEGELDVVVTDGFTGNMVLKTAEGTIKFITDFLKCEIEKSILSKIGAFLMKPIFKKLKQKMDSSEYGGAIFLGLSAISIKAHGNSDAVAIKNAIREAYEFAKRDFIEELRKVIERDEEENTNEN